MKMLHEFPHSTLNKSADIFAQSNFYVNFASYKAILTKNNIQHIYYYVYRSK